MTGRAADSPGFDRARARMVERDLAGRGLENAAVLDAMGMVPREAFLQSEAAARRQVQVDYGFVLGQLGDCARTRS